jgi:hypothetical protein
MTVGVCGTGHIHEGDPVIHLLFPGMYALRTQPYLSPPVIPTAHPRTRGRGFFFTSAQYVVELDDLDNWIE